MFSTLATVPVEVKRFLRSGTDGGTLVFDVSNPEEETINPSLELGTIGFLSFSVGQSDSPTFS